MCAIETEPPNVSGPTGLGNVANSSAFGRILPAAIGVRQAAVDLNVAVGRTFVVVLALAGVHFPAVRNAVPGVLGRHAHVATKRTDWSTHDQAIEPSRLVNPLGLVELVIPGSIVPARLIAVRPRPHVASKLSQIAGFSSVLLRSILLE